MRIQFEIKEKLPNIIGEILNSEKWMTLIKEDISGRKLVVIRDQAFDSEATVEIYSREVTIKTAWSRYTYRLFVLGDCVWCEYNGAYRGLLEQKLLPSITPKESLLDSEVLELKTKLKPFFSSLFAIIIHLFTVKYIKLNILINFTYKFSI